MDPQQKHTSQPLPPQHKKRATISGGEKTAQEQGSNIEDPIENQQKSQKANFLKVLQILLSFVVTIQLSPVQEAMRSTLHQREFIKKMFHQGGIASRNCQEEAALCGGRHWEAALWGGRHGEAALCGGLHWEAAPWGGRHWEAALWGGRHWEGALCGGRHWEGAQCDGRRGEGAQCDGRRGEGAHCDGHQGEGALCAGRRGEGELELPTPGLDHRASNSEVVSSKPTTTQGP
uniref:Uncharacterized protein n=1 Tax=Cyprinodon variegatus TaxID=28743 RepID=A0A3Q2E148_CYPVA